MSQTHLLTNLPWLLIRASLLIRLMSIQTQYSGVNMADKREELAFILPLCRCLVSGSFHFTSYWHTPNSSFPTSNLERNFDFSILTIHFAHDNRQFIHSSSPLKLLGLDCVTNLVLLKPKVTASYAVVATSHQ